MKEKSSLARLRGKDRGHEWFRRFRRMQAGRRAEDAAEPGCVGTGAGTGAWWRLVMRRGGAASCQNTAC